MDMPMRRGMSALDLEIPEALVAERPGDACLFLLAAYVAVFFFIIRIAVPVPFIVTEPAKRFFRIERN